MKIPVMRGLIDRRILANYTVDPEVLSRLLPAPFRPKLIRGKGVAGICLIRLAQLRPRFSPVAVGLSSENAAHRVAVEWDTLEGVRQGVFIPRRDSSSRLNTLLGGRVFPGVSHHARFDVRETETDFHIAIDSDDAETRVRLEGTIAGGLPPNSIFASMDEASAFFQAGSLGYSPSHAANSYDALELHTRDWAIAALDVKRIESSFFDDRSAFPAGAACFDCALVMRKLQHEWHAGPALAGATAPPMAACAEAC